MIRDRLKVAVADASRKMSFKFVFNHIQKIFNLSILIEIICVIIQIGVILRSDQSGLNTKATTRHIRLRALSIHSFLSFCSNSISCVLGCYCCSCWFASVDTRKYASKRREVRRCSDPFRFSTTTKKKQKTLSLFSLLVLLLSY